VNINNQSVGVTMNQNPSSYWSSTGVTKTQPPDRIIRAIVRKALAISSLNLIQRLHHTKPGMTQFPPMNERRIRQWLRELYPYEFRATQLPSSRGNTNAVSSSPTESYLF
jgi:hypothetical protein